MTFPLFFAEWEELVRAEALIQICKRKNFELIWWNNSPEVTYPSKLIQQRTPFLIIKSIEKKKKPNMKLDCILYCEFDNTQGSKIVHQYPPKFQKSVFFPKFFKKLIHVKVL